MAVKLKLKKGDRVIVTTGRDKGKSGEILAVFPQENRALVQGVNMVKRHQRQTQQNEGGIINREGKIHLSNLAIIDPKDGQNFARLALVTTGHHHNAVTFFQFQLHGHHNTSGASETIFM